MHLGPLAMHALKIISSPITMLSNNHKNKYYLFMKFHLILIDGQLPASSSLFPGSLHTPFPSYRCSNSEHLWDYREGKHFTYEASLRFPGLRRAGIATAGAMPAGLCKQCGEVEGGVEGVGGAMESGLRPHPQLQAAIVAVRQQVKEEAGYEGGAVEAESEAVRSERWETGG